MLGTLDPIRDSEATNAKAPADWALALGSRVAQARRRARLTQKALAKAAGISPVWLSKIERGRIYKYPFAVLAKLTPQVGEIGAPQLLPDMNSAGRRAPIYRCGFVGDPRDTDSSPDPDHEEYPPAGHESLVGSRGFGVLVRGEHLARRCIHDGDILWINPDRPHSNGKTVLARTWNDSGQDTGALIKTVCRSETASGPDILWDGPGTPLIADHFKIIGPVVGISPAFRLPG